MVGHRFSKYNPPPEGQKSEFERLLKIFMQLVLITSGNASEALQWLTEADRQHNLTTPQYGIGDFIEDLKKNGYLTEDPANGELKLRPKGEQHLRQSALEEIFGKLRKSKSGDHKTHHSGRGDERTTDRRDYEFGDTLEQISVTDSLRNAQINHGLEDFRMTEDDLEVVENEFKTQTSTVLMIDISHSMILYGEDRITPAKKVAMALAELITKKYAKDTLDILAFGDDAWQIEIKDLPYLQVGPFHTNTVAGLELAMDILRKRKNANKQVFMITDGKPTCIKEGIKYYKNSFGLDSKILNKTLTLATQLRKLKIPVTTFMIATDPYLKAFVREFTKANNGNAYYSNLQGLGNLVFEDFKKEQEKEFLKQSMKDLQAIKTVRQLRASGYQPKSIKQELRDNLIQKMRKKENVFEGIWGYEETVIPDLERAILAGHDINLLGLRGQAKTRLARLMVNLLDEWVPVIEGSELNDDPLRPISRFGRDKIAELGEDTPVSWLARDDRYTEKLATPDVSIADLIGDVDPIKAAALKLPYSDERVIHFGLIPRSHRCIFVINELPDLQARIQVALFNILQEGDIQIRGFKLRLLLELQFVFTANPEDYTNRGSIVTPLKDRIDSQIITHYPKSIETGKRITTQEAQVNDDQKRSVTVIETAKDLIEQVAFEARKSEYVDAKSGVSARLTISALENLVAAAERRTILNDEKNTHVRISDFVGVVPSITGKVELVYEGEQEGPGIVAQNLIGKAIRTLFVSYFPDPDKFRKQKEKSPYKKIADWFSEGHTIDLLNDMSNADYERSLKSVPGLTELVNEYQKGQVPGIRLFLMEFALHGMAEFSLISKNHLTAGLQFKDLLSSMFTLPKQNQDEDGGDDDFDDEALGRGRRN